jgi:hypothetical protein
VLSVVNRNNIIILMALICVSGLFYFILTTQRSSFNYLSENLEFSCESVQRVYDANNFYWKMVLVIRNVGENNAKLSSFYVGGKQVNSTKLIPPKYGFSANELSISVGEGETHKIELRVDAGCPQTILEKIKVSTYSNSNKMYNLEIRLI